MSSPAAPLISEQSLPVRASASRRRDLAHGSRRRRSTLGHHHRVRLRPSVRSQRCLEDRLRLVGRRGRRGRRDRWTDEIVRPRRPAPPRPLAGPRPHVQPDHQQRECSGGERDHRPDPASRLGEQQHRPGGRRQDQQREQAAQHQPGGPGLGGVAVIGPATASARGRARMRPSLRIGDAVPTCHRVSMPHASARGMRTGRSGDKVQPAGAPGPTSSGTSRAMHSTWCVIGNASKARSAARR